MCVYVYLNVVHFQNQYKFIVLNSENLKVCDIEGGATGFFSLVLPDTIENIN
jgi:hypothetical protein